MANRIFIAAFLIALPLCSYAQYDDMYFVPGKEKAKTSATVTASVGAESFTDTESDTNAQRLTQPVQTESSVVNGRDVDEYNRRYRSYDSDDDWVVTGDSADAEEAQAEKSRGVNDSQGSDVDYQYTKRILLFASPSVGIPVSSPLYWDLCYGPNAIYWNVYDDGFYAYAFPSSWNYLYYSPYFSWSWGYRPWGWYGGWYSSWYGGWYDPWYYPWYGPGYWHHPPYWRPPHHGIASRPVNRPSVHYRETLGNRNSAGANVRPARSGSSTRVTPTRTTTSGTRVTPTRTTTSGTRVSPTRTTTSGTRVTPTRTTTTGTRVTPSRSTSTSSQTYTPVRTTPTTTTTTRSYTPTRTTTSTPSYSAPTRSSGGGGGGGRVSTPTRSGGGRR